MSLDTHADIRNRVQNFKWIADRELGDLLAMVDSLTLTVKSFTVTFKREQRCKQDNMQ